jgi:uncharacterized membrane protein YhaH (DUF805 family)
MFYENILLTRKIGFQRRIIMSLFKLLFTFSGRIDRKTFIIGALISSPLLIVPLILPNIDESLYVLLLLGWAYIYGALGAKRLHDRGKSGWWALLIVAPIMVFIYFITWSTLKGTEGTNQFGEEPIELTWFQSS